MDKKSQTYLKKAVSLNNNSSALETVVSCYADIRKDGVSLQPIQRLVSGKAQKSLKYIEYFKKALSGKIGSTGVSLKIENPDFIRTIYESRLGDGDSVKKLCLQILQTVPWKDNFAVLVTFGTCYIPGTVESYDFIILTIQPCPLSKPEIIFDYKQNSFTTRGLDYVLENPAYSFLYPDINDGQIDEESCFFTAKTPKYFTESPSILKAVCDGKIPLAPQKHKSEFERLINASFDGNIPLESIRNIYARISELQADEEYSGVEVSLTGNELAEIITNSGTIDDSGQEKMNQILNEGYKEARFKASNLADASIRLETQNATISIPIADFQSLQTTTIDDREYYLFPKDYSLINGLTIK